MKRAAKIVSAVAIVTAVCALTTQRAEAGEYGRDHHWRWEHERGYVACPAPVYYCQPQPVCVVAEPVCVTTPAVRIVPEVIRHYRYYEPYRQHHCW